MKLFYTEYKDQKFYFKANNLEEACHVASPKTVVMCKASKPKKEYWPDMPMVNVR